MADDFVIPRLREGDPCPNCGTALRVAVWAQVRRNGGLIALAPVLLLMSMFGGGGGWGRDDAAVPKRDIYSVRCLGCDDVLDVVVRTWRLPGRL